MERDPKTGKFLPGNKTALGNRGNTKPKWGNENAVKHGLFAKQPLPKITKDGKLEIITGKAVNYTVHPDFYFIDQQGRVWLHDVVADKLEKMGIELKN